MNKNECFLGNFLDLRGHRYGRLMVMKSLGKDKYNHYRWECLCDCGKKINLDTSTLRTGHTKSCGCLRKEYWRDRKRKLPYFHLYTHVLQQCKRKKIFCNITFDNFLVFTNITKCHYCNHEITWSEYSSDNNIKFSSGYQLDRKNNSNGYTTENCVACCSLCNSTKSNKFNYSEMCLLGKSISKIKHLRRGVV